MKRLFWRLTMIFWALFVVVVCAFCVNFYLNYEKSYSQKLLEIDRNLNNIGELTNNSLNKYMNLVVSIGAVMESFYDTNYELYQGMSNEEINHLYETTNTGELVGDSQQNKIVSLTYLKTIAQLEKIGSELYEVYKAVNYTISNFEFIATSYLDIESMNIVDRIDFENNVVLLELEQNEETDKRRWLLAKEIMHQDEIIGYILLEYEVENAYNPLLYTMDNNIFYVGNKVYVQTEDSNLTLISNIEAGNMELTIRELANEGYYVSRYNPTDGWIKVIHYNSTQQLHEMVLRQTISLFEFSTILLIILFLFVSYLLFMVIIRPCYLLIDYVRRCGEGDYTIPAGINSSWRSSFVRIRNAYLENERLLAVKDNQSQELEYAWKKALVANQAKTHFLAKVSHELKTPLNAIKGYVQLLKLSIENPKQLRQIEIIDHSSDLLLKQVNELLDFSVIEDGKVKLEIDEINLFQTAHVIEELFIINVSQKNINYLVSVDEQIPAILYGDEARIKQIIINLMSNALKFTENGKIEVRFDLDYQTETEAYLSIRVKDTGKGIAENKLNSIFDSFTQENNSISRQFGGTGLGLSISKRLAEVMGGNLIVESEVNVGSIFTLFLPLSKVPIIAED